MRAADVEARLGPPLKREGTRLGRPLKREGSVWTYLSEGRELILDLTEEGELFRIQGRGRWVLLRNDLAAPAFGSPPRQVEDFMGPPLDGYLQDTPVPPVRDPNTYCYRWSTRELIFKFGSGKVQTVVLSHNPFQYRPND